MSSEAKVQFIKNTAANASKDEINANTKSSRDSGGDLSDIISNAKSTADKPATTSDGSIRTSMENASISINDKNNNDDINDEGEHGDDNDNAAQRASVIRRQIDPKRLKNSGLSLRIAQTVQQKFMLKQQQQQHLQQNANQQQMLKKKNDEKEQNDRPPATTAMNVSRIATSTLNIASTGGDAAASDQNPEKSTTLQSGLSSGLSKVLSVPKITITSPPCDSGVVTVSENKCERLEDVKRILNRQILMRKHTSNSGNTITAPLSNHREQPKMSTSTPTPTTTLQLPPHTIVKSIRKSEQPISTMTPTTTATNSSPLITVRKFHTIASPEMIIKSTATTTLPTHSTSQQQSQVYLTTIPGGTTIRPIMISNTSGSTFVHSQSTHSMSLVRPITLPGHKTVLCTQQNSGHGSNIYPISLPRSVSTQIQPQWSSVQSQQQRPAAFLTTEAIIRPVTAVRIQSPQFVTVRPITTLSNTSIISTQSPQFPQAANRTTFEQIRIEALGMQQPTINQMARSAFNANRYKIGPTIPTPKPKVFEIHGPKQSEHKEAEETKAKKPNIMKASLESKPLPLSLPQNMRSSQPTAATVPSKVASSSSTDKSNYNSTVPNSIMIVPKEQPIPTVQEHNSSLRSTDARASSSSLSSSSSSKTENVPIVLENKLLKPGEHIDLKGLRLPRRNMDDSLPKSNEPIPKKPTIDKKQAVQPAQSDQKTTTVKKKMHVIISNEKLKSAKVDMAALAKKVLQRASKTPAETSNVTLPKLPTKKAVKSNTEASSVDDKSQKIKSLTKPFECIVPKQKPVISKASMSLTKKDRGQPARQKALLREKVLAFCGLKNDVHVSPAKEYPKTVEIVDDENNTDDDDSSGPTAVDFIASLAMLNCSSSPTRDVDEQVIVTTTDSRSNELCSNTVANTHQTNIGEQQPVTVTPSNELSCSTAVKAPQSYTRGEQPKTDSKALAKKTSTPAKAKPNKLPFKAVADESTKQAAVDGCEMLEINDLTTSLPHEPVRQTVESDNRTTKTNKTLSTSLDVVTVHDIVEKEPQAGAGASAQNKDQQPIVVDEKAVDSRGKVNNEALIDANKFEQKDTGSSLSLKHTAINEAKSDDTALISNEISTNDTDTDVIKTLQPNDPNELSEVEKHVPNDALIDKDCSSSPIKSASDISTQLPQSSSSLSSSSSLGNAAAKPTRKRIGIRNAPINLIARKKPALKKLLTNESATTVDVDTTIPHEVSESVSIAISSKESVDVPVTKSANIQEEEVVVFVERKKTQFETKSESALSATEEQSVIKKSVAASKSKAATSSLSTTKLPAIAQNIEKTAKENRPVATTADVAKRLNLSTESRSNLVAKAVTAAYDNAEGKTEGFKSNSESQILCTVPAAVGQLSTPLHANQRKVEPSAVEKLALSPDYDVRMSINMETDKERSQKSECNNPKEMESVAVDQWNTPTDCVVSINVESDKEKLPKTDSFNQNKQEKPFVEHGIKILATVAISAERDEFSEAEAKKSLSTTETQPPLPEVGTIIDMKAYGLEKSNTEIIVQQMVFDNLNNTSSQDEVIQDSTKDIEINTPSEKAVIVKEVLETETTARSNACAIVESFASNPVNSMDGNDDNEDNEENESDTQSCHADINDNSDNDDHAKFLSRKRLRRKRPISAILSTSASEDETDEEGNRSLSRCSKILAVRSTNESSSASAELFRFSAQSAVAAAAVDSTDAEKQKLDNEPKNTIATMEQSTKKSESIYTSPFVTADSRRNVPLKKRWELSQQPSHEETDITDDTSPAADDTMDDEEIESNSLPHEVKEVRIKESSNELESLPEEKESTTIKDDAGMHVKEQKIEARNPHKRLNESSDAVNKPIGQAKMPKTTSCDANCSSASTSKSKPTVCTPTQQPEEVSISSVNHDEDMEVTGLGRRNIKLNTSKIESTSGDSEEELHKSTLRVQAISVTSSTPLPRKRGRPPKKVPKHDDPPPKSLDISTEIEDLEVIATTSTPAAAGQKKRGRKPRLGSLGTETVQIPSSKSGLQTEMGESKDVGLNLNLGSSTEASSPSPAQKKRGRKPKQSAITTECATSPQKATSKLEQRAHSVESAVDHVEDVNISTKKKRGRKPRASIEDSPAVTAATPKTSFKQRAEPTLSIDDAENRSVQETLEEPGELVIPTKKKRGRKPREKAETSVAVCETSFDNQTLESSKHQERSIQDTTTALSEITAESTTPSRRNRGKKPCAMTTSETQASISSVVITQGTPEQPNDSLTSKGRGRKKISVDDFNPRLLLIRRREQLDTDEVLTVADSEAGEGPLQCGLCLARTTERNWHKHLGEHYGVGWMHNKEPEVNIRMRSKVLSKMIAYFKQKETTLLCRLCSRSYRSPLGLLLHFESCGETVRVDCPTCGNQYTKLSYIIHQRTCKLTKKESNEESDKAPDLVLSNSGRFKRASQIKAETKLKRLTKALSDNDANFEPKDYVQYRESNEKGAYHCTVCPRTSFEMETDAIDHVVRKHKERQKSSKDFEADSSDFDENAEEGQESEESSTDNSTVESDWDEPAKNKSNIRKKKVADVKRVGGLPTVYSQRCHDVQKLVVRKWKQFLESNYTEATLYPYAIPIYGGETKRAIYLLSTTTESMKFTFSQKRKLFGVLGTPENLEWQQLQRFQSIDQRASDKLIYLGAPIKSLAWVPLPETVSEQYLVVSCRKSLTSFTRFHNPKSEDALLIIYKIATVKETDEAATKKGFQAKIHYVVYIQNGPVHTMAFLPSGGYDPVANRLGLLAVGTSSSDIKIYALPIHPAECEELRIEVADEIARVVCLIPALGLTLDATVDAQLSEHTLIATQCVHICWSEFSGHEHIFASFVNGFIGIWKVKEPQNPFYNLNCHIRDGRRVFTPINYFYFGEKFISRFAVHYDTSGPRWLALQGWARKQVVYDIRNMTQPMPIREDFLKNIPRDIDWSPVWEAFTTAFCNAIPNNGGSVSAFNPAGVNFVHSRMEFMLTGVSTLQYNPWQSTYGIGVDNGDIIYMNTREMHHDQQVLQRSKRNVMALSVLDIKRLDGEALRCPKTNDKSNTFQMHETDYKEKYGLVFAHITKFTSDERSAYLSEQRIPPPYVERYMRISVLRWNLNAAGKRNIAIGYENGFLRLTRFKRETYFD